VTGISVAKSLEAHLLQPLASVDDVRAACERAGEAHVAAVCVWPVHVAAAASVLAGSDTRVRAAIGFPYGQDTVDVRIAACDRAVLDGAQELAVMLDQSLLAAGDLDSLAAEVDRLLGHAWWSSLAGTRGIGELTVVLETMLVDLPALRPVLDRLHDSTAGFLQTGSGHQSRAVTEVHLRALREQLPADIAIVAVGGIATYEDAETLLAAGAVRVGSSAAAAIVEHERHLRAARQQAT
jgi:deoxyribose-phosphate aldolase